jgi:hypothetical protein
LAQQQYGTNGQTSPNLLNYAMTHSLNPLPPGNQIISLFAQHISKVKETCALEDWLKAQSKIPSVCWLRPALPGEWIQRPKNDQRRRIHAIAVKVTTWCL